MAGVLLGVFPDFPLLPGVFPGVKMHGVLLMPGVIGVFFGVFADLGFHGDKGPAINVIKNHMYIALIKGIGQLQYKKIFSNLNQNVTEIF